MILREGVAAGRTAGVAIGRNEGVAIGRDEGPVQEAREMLLRLGTRRFGAPTDAQVEKIAAETSRAQLEVWLLWFLDAPGWDIILG